MLAWFSGSVLKRGPGCPRATWAENTKEECSFDVRDESHYLATFQDLGSAPTGMSSGKFLDFLGLLPEWTLMQADAVRAYTQALLQGVLTYVRIPREHWPKAWSSMKGPVCPLVLALYGHPDAGTCWEQHCDKMLKQVGFEAIVNWSGCYRHNTLRAVLSVYVDDFKLAFNRADEKKAWALSRKHVGHEAPTPMKQYLGCGHSIHEGDLVAGVRVPGGFLPAPS